jgi:coproporphyrinogen III oxidase-like Fe-S oxidoreductase
MIRISVQVSSGAARFRVMVQAESIERALEIVARHNPGKECEVTFPIDPETFFVEDSVATVRQLAA